MAKHRIRKGALSLIFGAVAVGLLPGCSFFHKPLPEDCMRNSDPDTVLPELEDEFDTMAALPATGAPVYAVMTDPDNHFITCLVSQDELVPGQPETISPMRIRWKSAKTMETEHRSSTTRASMPFRTPITDRTCSTPAR